MEPNQKITENEIRNEWNEIYEQFKTKTLTLNEKAKENGFEMNLQTPDESYISIQIILKIEKLEN